VRPSAKLFASMKNLYEPGVDSRSNLSLYFTHWLYNLMVKYKEPLEQR
jgi:hypothetical protein